MTADLNACLLPQGAVLAKPRPWRPQSPPAFRSSPMHRGRLLPSDGTELCLKPPKRTPKATYTFMVARRHMTIDDNLADSVVV
jgi:hypothetical protein